MSSTSINSLMPEKTVATALAGIRAWDRTAGTRPLLSEQIALVRDEPTTWSRTHAWPSVRSAMISLGLARNVEPVQLGREVIEATEITPLGRAVRSALTTLGSDQ